jgi:hypothetical protein
VLLPYPCTRRSAPSHGHHVHPYSAALRRVDRKRYRCSLRPARSSQKTIPSLWRFLILPDTLLGPQVPSASPINPLFLCHTIRARLDIAGLLKRSTYFSFWTIYRIWLVTVRLSILIRDVYPVIGPEKVSERQPSCRHCTYTVTSFDVLVATSTSPWPGRTSLGRV